LRHKVIDTARRHRRDASVSIESIANVIPASPEMTGMEGRLSRSLNQLTRRQREVVEAVAINGNAVSDTARKLNISPRAVYVALHRAWARLWANF
jgi:RNA polymerase sigma-70 factor (ECF subfamily)